MAKAKSAALVNSGILHVILIFQFKIPSNRSLFYSALLFWVPSFNTFLFGFCLMRPTIQDISFLFDLLPHGEYFGHEYPSMGEFTYPKVVVKRKPKLGKTKHFLAFKIWLLYFSKDGNEEVTNEEYVAFLVYWLNKFIFGNSSVAITKEHTIFALALAIDKSLALAFIVSKGFMTMFLLTLQKTLVADIFP